LVLYYTLAQNLLEFQWDIFYFSISYWSHCAIFILIQFHKFLLESHPEIILSLNMRTMNLRSYWVSVAISMFELLNSLMDLMKYETNVMISQATSNLYVLISCSQHSCPTNLSTCHNVVSAQICRAGATSLRLLKFRNYYIHALESEIRTLGAKKMCWNYS
jgi:hypothetical protein